MTEEEGYHGPATLIDGRYHWYGRIEVSQELSESLGSRSKSAVLRTPHGEAAGQLSDPDTWGRYRISGISRPPFTVATSLEDVESN
jgi:hypothetical protein